MVSIAAANLVRTTIRSVCSSVSQFLSVAVRLSNNEHRNFRTEITQSAECYSEEPRHPHIATAIPLIYSNQLIEQPLVVVLVVVVVVVVVAKYYIPSCEKKTVALCCRA